jgi:radical SAM superfamily enzyme YgiQ (UPF0313 family)
MRAGHQMDFFDTLSTSVKNVASRVITGSYDVLMISTMTTLFPHALRLVRLVKRQRDIPTLLGGIHATIGGEQILADHPEIDYLCIGEGESMVAGFLEHVGKDGLFDVPNLAFRHNGTILANPCRPPEDLAKLPTFPWGVFPRSSIVQRPGGGTYVHATRGCPYRCTYCCNSVLLDLYGRGYVRVRPAEHVIDELGFLCRTYASRWFYFGDEMILSNVEYAIHLFQTLRENLNVPFGCMARVECITPELVKELADAGCRYIAMGIECGNEEFRREHLNRRMSNGQIERAFELVKQAGIFVTSFNMIGYPVEFDDQLTQETVKLNQKIRPDFVQISVFYPFPGTPLYQHCLDYDLIDHEKLAKTRHYFGESVLKGVSVRYKLYGLLALLNSDPSRWLQYGRWGKRTSRHV